MGPYIFEVHIGGVEGGQVQINNQIFVGGEDPIDDSGVLVVPTKFCGIRWFEPLSYGWYDNGNLVETLPFDPDPPEMIDTNDDGKPDDFFTIMFTGPYDDCGGNYNFPTPLTFNGLAPFDLATTLVVQVLDLDDVEFLDSNGFTIPIPEDIGPDPDLEPIDFCKEFGVGCKDSEPDATPDEKGMATLCKLLPQACKLADPFTTFNFVAGDVLFDNGRVVGTFIGADPEEFAFDSLTQTPFAFNITKNVNLNKVVTLDIDKDVNVNVNITDQLATAEADAEAFGPFALAEVDAYTLVTETEAFAYTESTAALDLKTPADTFTEIGDAGELIGEDQGPVIIPGINTIEGSLFDTGDIDLYQLQLGFDADVTIASSGEDLFLFDQIGRGLETALNELSFSGLEGEIFYLGVNGTVALNEIGGTILDPSTPSFVGPGTLTSWEDPGIVRPVVVPYQVSLTATPTTI